MASILSVYQHYIGSMQKGSVSPRGSKYVNFLVALVIRTHLDYIFRVVRDNQAV